MLGRMMFECLSLIMRVFDYKTCPGQISPQKSNEISRKFYFLFCIVYSRESFHYRDAEKKLIFDILL